MGEETVSRERKIDAILAERSAWGGVGIYGAPICVLCGEVGEYEGRFEAQFGSFFGPQRDFVCHRCRSPVAPAEVTDIGERWRLITALLTEARRHCCQLCGAGYDRPSRWADRSADVPQACDACKTELADAGIREGAEIREQLKVRRRRRFLERLSDDELDGMAPTVGLMRDALDAMHPSRQDAGSSQREGCDR